MSQLMSQPPEPTPRVSKTTQCVVSRRPNPKQLLTVEGPEPFSVSGMVTLISEHENSSVFRFDSAEGTSRHMVVKVFNCETSYEREKLSYEMAKPLQGGIVPQIYGVTRWYDLVGKPAIVMEFLKGQTASSAIRSPEQVESFEAELMQCYAELTRCGVCQADPSRENVMVEELDGSTRISIIDFELARLKYEEEDLERQNRNDANHIIEEVKRWMGKGNRAFLSSLS